MGSIQQVFFYSFCFVSFDRRCLGVCSTASQPHISRVRDFWRRRWGGAGRGGGLRSCSSHSRVRMAKERRFVLGMNMDSSNIKSYIVENVDIRLLKRSKCSELKDSKLDKDVNAPYPPSPSIRYKKTCERVLIYCLSGTYLLLVWQ